MLLEEIYPVAAYYQDTWQEGIQAVRVAGLGARLPEFIRPLEDEFHCQVQSLMRTAAANGRFFRRRPTAGGSRTGRPGRMDAAS